MPDFYFRGTLLEFWQVAYAEWLNYTHGDAHAATPLKISHPFKDHPPAEFEEVTLEFLDDNLRYPKPQSPPAPGITYTKFVSFQHQPQFHIPVTVQARSHPNEILVTLTVQIEKEAFQESGKLAYHRWKSFLAMLQETRLLFDSDEKFKSEKSPVAQDETERKLSQLRQIRRDWILRTGDIPKITFAMNMVKISHQTIKTHAPDLLKNWKNRAFE